MHGIDLKKINQEKSPVYSDYPKYFGYHSSAHKGTYK